MERIDGPSKRTRAAERHSRTEEALAGTEDAGSSDLRFIRSGKRAHVEAMERGSSTSRPSRVVIRQTGDVEPSGPSLWHIAKCLWLDFWDDFRGVLLRTAVVALVTAFAISAIMVAAEVWYGNSCVRWGKDTCGDHRIFVTKQHVKKRR